MKRPSTEEHIYEAACFENLFHNEILFYTKCAKLYTCSPELVYVFKDPPEESTIVIQNLSKEGYHLNSVKVNVSNKLMLAAVCELARFHAIGFTLKHKKSAEFFQIINETKNFDQVHLETKASFINCSVPRVIHYLRKENYDRDFCDKLEVFLKDPYSVLSELSKPIEPFATLCHGDFTINNILFKEENEDLTIKLIDFSMISYCSPFNDFSAFLLLSGTREQIKEKFPEIFNAYCDTLLQFLKEHGISNLEMFSKERLLKEYKRHVIFGYIIACFFRPCLMGCYGSNNEHLEQTNLEEMRKVHSTIGGDEMTKILVDMLIDLKEVGCLDHIINN